MPTYNRNFQLTINDVDMIEDALRARGRELGQTRAALNPADQQGLQAIDADLKAGEDLLGRLHNQKIFYRPRNTVYVGG